MKAITTPRSDNIIDNQVVQSKAPMMEEICGDDEIHEEDAEASNEERE